MDNNLKEMSKENLLELVEAQQQKIQELISKTNFYEEQIRLVNRQRYSRKSEKTPKFSRDDIRQQHIGHHFY